MLPEQMRRLASCAALAGMLTGCYTLQPVSGTSLQVGTKVAFDVNDAGRVGLGVLVGPEIGRIDGLLVGRDNGEYFLAVTGVRFLRGGEQVWTGERVGIKSEYLGTTYERRFSKGRTVALGVAIVGGLAAVVASRDLFGLGSTGRPEPPDSGGTTLIFRRP
jgi:hypothetical protein